LGALEFYELLNWRVARDAGRAVEGVDAARAEDGGNEDWLSIHIADQSEAMASTYARSIQPPPDRMSPQLPGAK
jgi:hypothetical protein